MKTSPFGGSRGLTNSRIFFHEKMIFSFPKNHFLIPYFYFLIIYFLRHKYTKSQRNTKAFFISEMKTSSFGGLGGLTNSRIIIHEKMIFLFPKNHFYILHFTFNILHFLLRHQDTKSQRNSKAFFYFRNENFPLRGIEGAHEFTNFFS